MSTATPPGPTFHLITGFGANHNFGEMCIRDSSSRCQRVCHGENLLPERVVGDVNSKLGNDNCLSLIHI